VAGDDVHLLAVKPHAGYARIGRRRLNLYQCGAVMVLVNAVLNELEAMAADILAKRCLDSRLTGTATRPQC
jgi:hypothetical protein